MASKAQLRDELKSVRQNYFDAQARWRAAESSVDRLSGALVKTRGERDRAYAALAANGFEYSFVQDKWVKKPAQPETHVVVKTFRATDVSTYPARPLASEIEAAVEDAVSHLHKMLDGRDDIDWSTIRMFLESPTDRFSPTYQVRVTVKERVET